MIIRKEKYKHFNIVYIDERIEKIDDLPVHVGFECLSTSLENLNDVLQEFMALQPHLGGRLDRGGREL